MNNESSEAWYEMGDLATCKTCGEEIIFSGHHWVHGIGETQHPAFPSTTERPQQGERDNESEKQYRMGDTAVCRSCGIKIFYNGRHWVHDTGGAQPRHIGQPLEAMLVARPGHVSIALERERQIKMEGWDAAHDDQWANDELVRAAVYYALPRRYDVLIAWPWLEEFNKKHEHGRIRQLEIAGALIAAEIDRLQRLGQDR